jgi:hypothetical protein
MTSTERKQFIQEKIAPIFNGMNLKDVGEILFELTSQKFIFNEAFTVSFVLPVPVCEDKK